MNLDKDKKISQLRKTNQALYKELEELRQDCYKCVCGVATACNCKHLGLLPKHLTNFPERDNLDSILKDLGFS